MEKHFLSKSTFIRGAQCLKSLYLHKKRPFLRDPLSAEQRAKFSRGSDVGVLARDLFPGGINLQPKSPSQYRKAVLKTKEVIEEGKQDVIYEAAFQADGVLILLDVLVRTDGKWKAYEVKSSKKISSTYLLDAALQYYVITHAGIELEDFSLIHINPEYVLQDKLDLKLLFVQESVLKEVHDRQEYVKEQIEKEKEVLQFKHSPKIPIGKHCFSPYPCDFIGHCWKHLPENSLFDLPQLSLEEKFDFYGSGLVSPAQLQGIVPESKLNSKLLNAQIQGEEYIDKEKVQRFIRPEGGSKAFIYILFNRPALPAIKGTRPYQLTPLAASVVKQDGNESLENSQVFINRVNAFEECNTFLGHALKGVSHLIIYDQPEIAEYLSLAETDLETEKMQFMNLHELLLNVFYYHPGLKSDHGLHNFSKHILKQDKHIFKSDTEAIMATQDKMSRENKEIDHENTKLLDKYVRQQSRIIKEFYHFLQDKSS